MTAEVEPTRREELEASLENSRLDLETAVEGLKEVARDALTPGEVLARRPYLWLIGAFGAGVLLSRR